MANSGGMIKQRTELEIKLLENAITSNEKHYNESIRVYNTDFYTKDYVEMTKLIIDMQKRYLSKLKGEKC